MYIFGIHFHKWVPIQQKEKYEFYGENCERLYKTGYRKCIECGDIQEYFYDSQGGYWYNIPECENRILSGKIVIKKGLYYMKEMIDLRNYIPPAQK